MESKQEIAEKYASLLAFDATQTALIVEGFAKLNDSECDRFVRRIDALVSAWSSNDRYHPGEPGQLKNKEMTARVDYLFSNWLRNSLGTVKPLSQRYLSEILEEIDDLSLNADLHANKGMYFSTLGPLIDDALGLLRSNFEGEFRVPLANIVVSSVVCLNKLIRTGSGRVASSERYQHNLQRVVSNLHRAVSAYYLVTNFNSVNLRDVHSLKTELNIVVGEIKKAFEEESENLVQNMRSELPSNRRNFYASCSFLLATNMLLATSDLNEEQVNESKGISEELLELARDEWMVASNNPLPPASYLSFLLVQVQVRILILRAMTSTPQFMDDEDFAAEVAKAYNQLNHLHSEKKALSAVLGHQSDVTLLAVRRFSSDQEFVYAAVKDVLDSIVSGPDAVIVPVVVFKNLAKMCELVDDCNLPSIVFLFEQSAALVRNLGDDLAPRVEYCMQVVMQKRVGAPNNDLEFYERLSKLSVRPKESGVFASFVKSMRGRDFKELLSKKSGVNLLYFNNAAIIDLARFEVRNLSHEIEERPDSVTDQTIRNSISMLRAPFNFQTRIFVEEISKHWLRRSKETYESIYLRWCENLLQYGLRHWDDVYWYSRLSAVQRLQGNLSQSLATALQATDKYPGDVHLALQLALAEQKSGNAEDSAARLERIIRHQKGSNHPAVLSSLAESEQSLGRPDVAVDLYLRILDEYPTDLHSMLGLSRARFEVDPNSTFEILKPAIQVAISSSDSNLSAVAEMHRDSIAWIAEVMMTDHNDEHFDECVELLFGQVPQGVLIFLFQMLLSRGGIGDNIYRLNDKVGTSASPMLQSKLVQLWTATVIEELFFVGESKSISHAIESADSRSKFPDLYGGAKSSYKRNFMRLLSAPVAERKFVANRDARSQVKLRRDWRELRENIGSSSYNVDYYSQNAAMLEKIGKSGPIDHKGSLESMIWSMANEYDEYLAEKAILVDVPNFCRSWALKSIGFSFGRFGGMAFCDREKLQHLLSGFRDTKFSAKGDRYYWSATNYRSDRAVEYAPGSGIGIKSKGGENYVISCGSEIFGGTG